MTLPGSSSDEADLSFGQGPAAQPDLAEADLIRAAVLNCADVIDLSPGPLGEVASYLPGRAVPGVRVDDARVEVHVVARYGQPLQAIADQISGSVGDLLAGRPLTVAVDDILLPGESLGASEDDAEDSSSPQ